ncbi:MAG: GNAT family N-acetyltransferase [Chloroflexi bacterium]|nr:GNAT family N-acetyltransferase [Chloroflexota bacterium]
MHDILLRTSPALDNHDLNALFAAAWEGHVERDFTPILSRSLLTVCAFHGDRLIGFVNVAWDGGIHAFLLDTTVHPDFQRRGLGQRLVCTAIEAAGARGIEWMHVDYEPHLHRFYQRCGFQPTQAGLVNLRRGASGTDA